MSSVTPMREQESAECVRGPFFATCASIYARHQSENEQKLAMPTIVIHSLKSTVATQVTRKTKSES